jgi:hypothetical protein
MYLNESSSTNYGLTCIDDFNIKYKYINFVPHLFNDDMNDLNEN